MADMIQGAGDGGSRRDRPGIGVVGLNFGAHVVRNELLAGPGARFFKLVAVCDQDRPKAEAMAAELGIRPYGDLEALLADPAVEVVGLYTGPAGRADLLRRIIRADKDVMTTKPFELDADAGLAVLREARALGRVIHLNSPSALPASDLRQILAWRDRYDLGQPVACRMEAWAPYFEKADGSWYDDAQRCPVAPVFRIGIYLVNDLLTLLGEPECVTVLSSRIRTGRPTADNGQLSLRFRNGALANVFASLCVGDGQSWRNTATVNYERGTIYRNPPPSPRASPTQLLLVRDEGKGAAVAARAELQDYSGMYDWESFHRAVRGEPLPGELTPEQIVLGIRVIHAMARAEQSGRCEKIGETGG